MPGSFELRRAWIGLALCAGCKDEPIPPADDSDAPVVDSDADGLSDAEELALGTDPDEPDTDHDGCGDLAEVEGGLDPLDPTDSCYRFRPHTLFFSVRGAFDGQGLQGYTSVSPGGVRTEITAPWVEVVLVTEDYFASYDPVFRCVWYAEIVPEGGVWTPREADWLSLDVRLQVSANPEFAQTDCFGFDEQVWPEGAPAPLLESTAFTLGWGPMSAPMRADLQALIELSGLDWAADWAPNAFALRMGINGAEPEETGYTLGYALDESFAWQVDEAGEPRVLPLADATALPPMTYLGGGDLYGIPASALTGE